MNRIIPYGTVVLALLSLAGCDKKSPTASNSPDSHSVLKQEDLYRKWVQVGEADRKFFSDGRIEYGDTTWDASNNNYETAIIIDFAESISSGYSNNLNDDSYYTGSDSYSFSDGVVTYNPNSSTPKLSPTVLSDDTLYTSFFREDESEDLDSIEVIYAYVQYDDQFPPQSWVSSSTDI